MSNPIVFDYRGSLIRKVAGGGGEEGFVLVLTFWGPLVDRLGCKELKLVEKEDRKTKKVEENMVKKAKNRGKERFRLGGTWHIWGSMTMRHGLVG